MRAPRLSAAWLTVGALIAGCGSSAEPTYFVLFPAGGQARQAPGPRVVKLRRPGLAGYLDRATVVRRAVDYKLGVSGDERWGEPLGNMIGRVLADDLNQRLPGTSVFTEDGAISADADAVVEINIGRFDVGRDGAVELAAEVALEMGQSHIASSAHAVRLSARPAGNDTKAMVATMSDLLGQFADQIATMVREAAAKGPAPTPPQPAGAATSVAPALAASASAPR